MITKSQAVNILVLGLMIAFVAFVQWAGAKHIYIPPVFVALAGLLTTVVAGVCRSYVGKFAGLLPNGTVAGSAPTGAAVAGPAGSAAPADIAGILGQVMGLFAAHQSQAVSSTAASVAQAVTDINKTQQMNRADLAPSPAPAKDVTAVTMPATSGVVVAETPAAPVAAAVLEEAPASETPSEAPENGLDLDPNRFNNDGTPKENPVGGSPDGSKTSDGETPLQDVPAGPFVRVTGAELDLADTSI